MTKKNSPSINIGNNNTGQINYGRDINVTQHVMESVFQETNHDKQEGAAAKETGKKILVLSANPKTTDRLRLEEEVREIQEGLRRATQRDLFTVDIRLALRPRDLRRALLDVEPHIVHFSGHGDKEGLVLEDELGFATLVSAQFLGDLFQLLTRHVQCVVLNACYSAFQAKAISRHIPYVIGMKKEIKDKAGIEFAVGFYDALGAGKNIEQAFKYGRNAIQSLFPNLPEHMIPMLKKGATHEG